MARNTASGAAPRPGPAPVGTLGAIPPAPLKRDHSGNVAPASQTQAQDHTTAEPADANAEEAPPETEQPTKEQTPMSSDQ